MFLGHKYRHITDLLLEILTTTIVHFEIKPVNYLRKH
jgi:hypothetical protein